ncbi:unnamed protein product, partial [Laminaria digitata]
MPHTIHTRSQHNPPCQEPKIPARQSTIQRRHRLNTYGPSRKTHLCREISCALLLLLYHPGAVTTITASTSPGPRTTSGARRQYGRNLVVVSALCIRSAVRIQVRLLPSIA